MDPTSVEYLKDLVSTPSVISVPFCRPRSVDVRC